MPSREEIAGWLREAGKVDAALARVCVSKAKINDFCAPWEDRAAQVENMRCENCEYWNPPNNRGYDDFCNTVNEVYNMGPNFGCWNFKQKVK